MNSKPDGQRFTFAYRDRSILVEDSTKMRLRIAELLRHIIQRSSDFDASAVAGLIRRELGVPVSAYYTSDLVSAVEAMGRDDFLDMITIMFVALGGKSNSLAIIWRDQIARILAEERISLRIDDLGGIHLAVDEEFALNRQATIAALNKTRYNGVTDFFDQAYAALDERPADTRHAVRAMYEAIENLFKLMLAGQASRLGKTEIDKYLKPKMTSLYNGHDLDSSKLMLSSLSEWVNGMQQYRHAPGATDPSGPPLDLAIFILSSGSSYLRWLLQIDEKLAENRYN